MKSWGSQPLRTLIVHTLCNGPFKENCYLIQSKGANEVCVIDPGSSSENILEYINSKNLTTSFILLTHGHFDHLGAVERLMDELNIPCFVSELERKLVRQAGIYAYRFAQQRLVPPNKLTYLTFPENLNWGSCILQGIHTPGHTNGGTSYLFNGEALFTGDTLFHSYVGPTNYPESSDKKLWNSVNMLINSAPGECRIFPGHGESWLASEAKIWWAKVSDCPPKFYLFGDKKL